MTLPFTRDRSLPPSELEILCQEAISKQVVEILIEKDGTSEGARLGWEHRDRGKRGIEEKKPKIGSRSAEMISDAKLHPDQYTPTEKKRIAIGTKIGERPPASLIPVEPPFVNLISIPQSGREGQCYILSGSFVLDNPGWTLTHATLYPRGGPFDNQVYFHAFAERGGMVFDTVIGSFFDKKEYYNYFSATDIRNYSNSEVRKHVLESGHWGSWE
jgi:hypothetical protein